jgi:hypothetical protein
MAGIGLASLGISGIKGTQKLIKSEVEKYKRALGKALLVEGNEIMSASKQIVPHKTGTLQRSGVVRMAKVSMFGEMYVEVGYGTKYALPVHEGPQRVWSKPGKTNKYLKIPYDKRLFGWEKRVALNTQKYVKAARAGKGKHRVRDEKGRFAVAGIEK